MDYYTEKQYLAHVDRQDNILGKIERWEAHQKRVLHRAFTACLQYKGQAILQHRRHILFDGLFDLTCSSHPVFKGEEIESNEEAVYKTLEREWFVTKDKLTAPLENKGSVYYQADDPMSSYGEHEICYFFVANIDTLPQPNFAFAYGYSLVAIEKLKDPTFILSKVFVPWVPPCLNML